MKCPKCGYLGFEHADRCRNCGYEFSLAAPAGEPELPLNDESDEIELFPPTDSDDTPLITTPSAPRTPLSVRRPTPEVQRIRTVAPRTPSLELAFEAPPGGATAAQAGSTDLDESNAGLGARLGALLIDAVLLAAVDAAVVYFTLQICGIGVDELALLPRAPLAAFILLQNGGYLVAFTAGGQTLGKMAMGIRVVSVDPDEGVHAGRAMIREVTRWLLALPAGLGLLPAVFSHDHRGLHDRFAGTRVVRA
jgi:uncharacterized RDD family membrane protein YckC